MIMDYYDDLSVIDIVIIDQLIVIISIVGQWSFALWSTDLIINQPSWLLDHWSTVITYFTEMVVGEAVVVIKKLIQLQPKEHKDLIVHVAKLVDTVTVSSMIIM